MRGVVVAAIVLALLPAAASAVVPPLTLFWYNGDLDSPLADLPGPAFGPGFTTPNARIGDLDGDGENEMVINGHAFGNARFARNMVPSASGVVQKLFVPATSLLEFDVEARAGGDCFVYHDFRVILVGALDPLPALDTLYDLNPVLPVDYFNDEVLAFGAQYQGAVLRPGHVVLEPKDALMLGGGFPGTTHPFNGLSDDEKEIFLSQHFYGVWVFYGAAYEGGASNDGTECAFDNFSYTVRAPQFA